MSVNDNMTALAAAFDDHQITDDGGQILEDETSTQDSAFEEENAVDDSTEAEKPTEPEYSETNAEDDGEDDEHVVDDAGKAYVPKKAFDKNYAKRKEAERLLAERDRELEMLRGQEKPVARPVPISDRGEALENELLFTKMPEFDPYAKEYNPTLDESAAFIYNSYRDTKGKPTITKLQAAREAKRIASELTKQATSGRAEVRQVKMQTEGSFSQAARKVDTTPKAEDMDLDYMEKYLKEQGAWDKFN